MKMAHLAGKIPPEWYSDIQEIKTATGQSDSDVLREEIALYLKKAKVPIVRSRLDELEEKLSKLTALVMRHLPSR
jgi:hypothetical protein